ncbi:MAG: precorrin-6A reductase [Syntrophaceae bacterium]
MILLLGGTAEAAPIARALMKEGYEVLLSTATSLPSRDPLPRQVQRRIGVLDEKALVELIRARRIRAVVDATHPYSETVSANAGRACRVTAVPYLGYERPGVVDDAPDIVWATDHGHASALACSFSRPILLTIGSRHLAPYVSASRDHGVKIVARVMDEPSSLEYCRHAGLRPEEIVPANGPFSEQHTADLISRYRIGVLVTRDSGEAGGVRAKIAAARKAGCRIVVLKRPRNRQDCTHSIPDLVKAVQALQPLVPA